MSAAEAAKRAALKHLAYSGMGMGAGLALWFGFHWSAGAYEPPPNPYAEAAAAAGGPGQETSSSGSGPKDELQLVQVVFRHGARTPLGRQYWREMGPVWDVCGKASWAGMVPLEVTTEDGRPQPHNPDDQKQVDLKYEGGCHKGELTLIGQQQALDFGRWLRWRYAMVHPLLPDAWEPGAVAARSTNYQRTLATLQGVLSGLFPGTARPIPVHTCEEIDEVLYTNVRSCGKLHTLLKGLRADLQRNHHPQGDHERVEELQGRVRAALGLPADHRVHWVDLHDALSSLLTHGKAVPEALRDPGLLRGVNELATARFMHVTAPHPDTGKRREVLKLSMGVLMQLMVQRLEAAAGGANGTKMYLYSGHDSSLMPLLAALGKHVGDWPPYLSNLALELWRRPQGGHYVKVLYNRQPLPLTELCGSPECDLQLFKEKVIGPYLLTRDQHQKECMLHFLHDRPAGEHMEAEDVAVGSSFQDSPAAAAAAARPAAAPAAAAGGGAGGVAAPAAPAAGAPAAEA